MVGRCVSLRPMRAALCVCLLIFRTPERETGRERTSHYIEKRRMKEKEAHDGGPH